MSNVKINDLMLPPARLSESQPQPQPGGASQMLDLINHLPLGENTLQRSGDVQNTSVWAGPDGRGCIPTDLPVALPPIREFPPYGGGFPREPRIPIDIWPIPVPPIGLPDVSPEDRSVASRLHSVLSDPETLLNGMFDSDCGETTLQRTPGGVQGPDGQPLFPVKTDFGTAYVDPNTNQFYLQEPGFGGQMNAIGPMDLPEGCQFDPEKFYNPAEVRELGGIARGGGWDPLHAQDRGVAKNLHQTLSGPQCWEAMRDPFVPTQTLQRGPDGAPRGPDGQALISVHLDSGQQAFVDPNTNQYYLREGAGFGGVEVKGPLSLPENARFTNSYFNDKDVAELNRIAQRPIVPRFYTAL